MAFLSLFVIPSLPLYLSLCMIVCGWEKQRDCACERKCFSERKRKCPTLFNDRFLFSFFSHLEHVSDDKIRVRGYGEGMTVQNLSCDPMAIKISTDRAATLDTKRKEKSSIFPSIENVWENISRSQGLSLNHIMLLEKGGSWRIMWRQHTSVKSIKRNFLTLGHIAS